MSLLDLEWWAYLFMVLTFFIACLGLNYVVKKINEAKIDERFIRMLHKASTTQSTQVNGPLIVMETSKGLRQNSSKTAQPSPTGISLVFNQEENKRRKDIEDTYNIIKNSIDPKRFESLSLNTNRSQETLDLPIIKSDHRINEIVTNKIIESNNKAHTPVPKETSSHTQINCNGTEIEKVLVKKNEYGHTSTKETSSTDQSDCYVTEIITIKKNEFGFVPAKNAPSGIISEYNVNEIIALKDTERIVAKETTYLVQSDSNDRENVPKPKSESTEESISVENEGTSSGARSVNVNDLSLIKKNEPNRIVPKPNVPGITITESKIREAINKAKKEIDLISLKKTLDSTFLKTTDTTAKNEGSPINKAVDVIAVKEAVSQSGRNELSPVKTRDPGDIAAKDALLHSQSDRKSTELCPVKLSDSGNSTAKDHSSHMQSYRYVTEKPVKISDSTHLVAQKNSSHITSDLKVAALCPVKMSDSDAAKNISSHALSVHNVTVSPVKQNKSGQLAAKDTSLHIKSDGSITKLSPVKKSERLTDQVTSSHTRSDQKVSKEVTDKKEENVESDASASHTQTDRHVTAIISVTKSEPKRTTKQVTSSHIRNVRKEAIEIPIKIESDRMIATSTATPTQIGGTAGNLNSIKKSEALRIADPINTTHDRSHPKESDNITGMKESDVNAATVSLAKSEFGQEVIKANSSHARSDRKESDELAVKKESGRITATATASHTETHHTVAKVDTKKSKLGQEAVATTSSHARSDHKESEIITAKKEANLITVTATASHTQTDRTQAKVDSTKKSEFRQEVVKATSSHARSDRKDSDDVTNKREANANADSTSSFHTQTDRSVAKADSAKKSEFGREVIKATSSHAQIVKKSEEITAKKDSERIAVTTASHMQTDRQVNEGVSGKKQTKTDHKTATTTSSFTQTDPNITKFRKKNESERKVTKVISKPIRSDDQKAIQGVTGEIDEADRIAATATTSHTQTDRAVTGTIPVTISGRIAAKEITTNTPSNRNVTELVPVTMSVATNKSQNTKDEETTFTKRSDVSNIRINEPVRITEDKSVPEVSAIKKSNTNVQSGSFVKKTIDTNVAQTDDSRNANENPQTGLKERIKALLTPPVMNEDVMILKPSPSSKK